MAERSDGLGLSVFVDGETSSVEASHDMLLVVDDGRMKYDLFYLLAENKDAIVARI